MIVLLLLSALVAPIIGVAEPPKPPPVLPPGHENLNTKKYDPEKIGLITASFGKNFSVIVVAGDLMYSTERSNLFAKRVSEIFSPEITSKSTPKEDNAAKGKKQLSILVATAAVGNMKSHLNFDVAIANALAEEHSVTLFMACQEHYDMCKDGQTEKLKEFFQKMNQLRAISRTIDNLKAYSEDDLKNLWLKQENLTFDVCFTEQEVGMDSGYPLSHMLGIKKVVTILPNSMVPADLRDATDLNNNPLGLIEEIMDAKPPVPPVHSTKIGDHDEVNRTEERNKAITEYYARLLNKKAKKSVGTSEVKEDAEPINKFGEKYPGEKQIYKSSRFYLVNSHRLLEWKPEIFDGKEKILMLGGIHISSNPGKIDQAILTKSGNKRIIPISFGGAVGTDYSVGEKQFSAIEGAIREFTKRHRNYFFVWHLSQSDKRAEALNKSDLKSNVYAASWLNIPALLASPRTAAFISHCGKNSQIEAIHYSKKVICAAYFVDQQYNAETLAKYQLAISLDYRKIEGIDKDAFTKQSILDALEEIVTESGNRIDGSKVKKIGSELRENLRSHSPKKSVLDAAGKILEELQANL